MLIFMLTPLDQFGLSNSISNIYGWETTLAFPLATLASFGVLLFPCLILFTTSFSQASVLTGVKFIFDSCFSLIRSILLTNVPIKIFSMLEFVFYIFLIIFTANLLGLNPLFFSTTAAFVFPLLLSSTYFIGINFLLIWQAGASFVQFFIPSGLPLLMVPAIWPIELVSHCIKVLSLAIRLFANIFAGHVLVTVLSTASFSAITTPALSGVGLFVLLPIIVMIQTLEVFICFLQAYVFSVLSVIYLNEALTYADH